MSERIGLYRRQFFAGPRASPIFPSWHRVDFAPRVIVACHPELLTTLVEDRKKRLLCLGCILDPSDPSATNEDVLRSTLSSSPTFDQFETNINGLAGRWVMFAEIDGQIRLYHDAGGLKSVFYYTPPDEREIWLAAQPGLFTELFGLKRDGPLCEEFFAHRYQNSWPCELTPYPNVRQLLPNHYLDLQVREAKRFWPTKDVEPISLEDAAASMAKTIRGIVACAAHRGPVALPLTGGYESRVTFSCIGDLRKTIPLFLITGPNSLLHDTVISKRLARRFGVSVNHHRVSGFSQYEWELLLRNTGDMFWDPAANFIFTFGDHYQNHAILVGAMGTVARAWLYKDGSHPAHLDGERIASIAGYRGNPVAVKGFAQWLEKAPTSINVPLLDLLFWEHRQGNWASLTATAFDGIGCDMIAPYNCRRMMEVALGVDVNDRKPPHNLLKKICEITAGSEALSIPLNYDWWENGFNRFWDLLPALIRRGISYARMRLAGVPENYLRDARFF